MNHRGQIPRLYDAPEGRYIHVYPRAPFLSTFPVRYWLIDFNHSVYYQPAWDLKEPLAKPYLDRQLRPQHPPEIYGPGPFNPFAADIYQAGRLFYSFIHVCLLAIFEIFDSNAHLKRDMADLPGLLELLQDMTKPNPPDRISAAAASARMQQLQSGYSYDTLEQARDIDDTRMFPEVPEP